MSDRAPLVQAPDAARAALLLATLNSFALDFATRTSVGGTDLSYFIVKQLPVPDPAAFLAPFAGATYEDFILPRVLELSYTSWSLEGFARDLGYDGPPFAWDEERRLLIRCELDAAFFHLFGLDEHDVAYVLDTFPIIRDREEARFGEYRSKREILTAYRRMAAALRSGADYVTALAPAPGFLPDAGEPKAERR